MLQLHVSSAHWLYITVSYTRLLLPCTNMYECNDELFWKLMAYGTIGVGVWNSLQYILNSFRGCFSGLNLFYVLYNTVDSIEANRQMGGGGIHNSLLKSFPGQSSWKSQRIHFKSESFIEKRIEYLVSENCQLNSQYKGTDFKICGNINNNLGSSRQAPTPK